MFILLVTFWVFIACFFTWGMYLAVMNLMAARKTMPLVTKLFAYPLAAIGIIMDVLINIIVGTILFLELPKTWLLTARLQSHLDDTGWRGSIAVWICANLLDPFDARGYHCRKPK